MNEIFIDDLKLISNKIKQYNEFGKIIGFVPTMGNLHEGHLSLINKARLECDEVIVSIFINKKQFNDKNDYLNYPKTLDSDINLLKKCNVSHVFYPKNNDIYPENFSCSLSIPAMDHILCASDRPGHFDGVALILTKLFNIITPNKVYFGLKDYQQFILVNKLVDFLNFNIDVIGVDTVREDTGLALSSRNNLLTSNERLNIAPILFAQLIKIKNLVRNVKDISQLLIETRKFLLESGFSKVDYLTILDNDLKEVKTQNYNNSRIFAAAYIRNIRLIDNIAL
ncbi:MAG: pantoate--beta-alanine ligase [Rickettsiales bacterium]|nr:pantoate--beta-alanine ligase [Rickettsiales bacterium]